LIDQLLLLATGLATPGVTEATLIVLPTVMTPIAELCLNTAAAFAEPLLEEADPDDGRQPAVGP
jgi:hypothetical protein